MVTKFEGMRTRQADEFEFRNIFSKANIHDDRIYQGDPQPLSGGTTAWTVGSSRVLEYIGQEGNLDPTSQA